LGGGENRAGRISFASVWEILVTSDLHYNKTLGRTNTNSGVGPPSVSGNTTFSTASYGWIRSGGAGDPNCLNWTSSTRLIRALPASLVVALAGYAGLTHPEIRALLWENFDGKAIRVTQKATGSHIGPPKTTERGNDIAVIPQLKKLIEDWSLHQKKRKTGLMFPSEVGTPLLLNNLLNRSMFPILKRCGFCHEPESAHNSESDHEYVRERHYRFGRVGTHSAAA